jgi:hypothetical protein
VTRASWCEEQKSLHRHASATPFHCADLAHTLHKLLDHLIGTKVVVQIGPNDTAEFSTSGNHMQSCRLEEVVCRLLGEVGLTLAKGHALGVCMEGAAGRSKQQLETSRFRA